MFRKILVPLDGSEMAAKILPEVSAVAKCLNARVILLHVCYFPTFPTMEVRPRKMARQTVENGAKECTLFLAKAAEELRRQGLKVSHECVEGVPAREIIAYAEAHNVDLIAMATHGRGEVAWILGSTAEKVITHATVPTLLFRVMKTRVPETKGLQK